MIIMFPTPLLPTLSKLLPDYKEQILSKVFWFFWSGVYIAPEDLTNYFKYLPLYVLYVLLIFEKVSQRWLTNRFGCTN